MDTVSLRDYFERIIHDLEEKFNISRIYNETALKIQATETERRLDALNHENARVSEFQAASVTKDVHERDIKEINGKLEVLTLAMTKVVTQDVLAATLKTPTEEIRGLTSTSDVLSGRASQQSVDKASSRADLSMILAILGTVIGVAALISRFIK